MTTFIQVVVDWETHFDWDAKIFHFQQGHAKHHPMCNAWLMFFTHSHMYTFLLLISHSQKAFSLSSTTALLGSQRQPTTIHSWASHHNTQHKDRTATFVNLNPKSKCKTTTSSDALFAWCDATLIDYTLSIYAVLRDW